MTGRREEMKQYRTFVADTEDRENMTVERFLRKRGGFTKHQISRAKFRPDGIMRNGIRCRVTETVCPGDEIRICLEEEGETSAHLLDGEGNLAILYEDRDLLIVNKPAGVVTHPRGQHFRDSLANQAAAYFRRKQEEHAIRPIGRLDKDTSGIVVFAKNQTAASGLQRQREEGLFTKTYLAVVRGKLAPDEKEHQIRMPMIRDPDDRRKMMVSPEGKPAVTKYCVLNCGDNESVVKVTLETGRTHQIRVHMAGIGHPLVGDPLYGYQEKNNTAAVRGLSGQRPDMGSRAMLHAWKAELCQPFSGEKIEVTAEIPEDMAAYTHPATR